MVRIAGTDRALSYADIANLPGATPEKVKSIGEFVPPEATYPNGTHTCEVEIDPDTGMTKIVGYTVVDDFGMTLNPMLLAGQVHGGIAQGVGQALLERTVYGDDGQLLSASLMDYCMPRADDLPSYHFETRNIPSTTNPLGLKGAGEAGSIGSTPAVMNAVVDALYRAYGIAHLDMPATPLAVFAAIAAAGGHVGVASKLAAAKPAAAKPGAVKKVKKAVAKAKPKAKLKKTPAKAKKAGKPVKAKAKSAVKIKSKPAAAKKKAPARKKTVAKKPPRKIAKKAAPARKGKR